MIFICDNQFSLPTSTTDKALKAFAFQEAGVIYKSLYYLSDDVSERVEGINLLIEGSSLNEKSILKILKRFSADIEDYPDGIELKHEIWESLPTRKEWLDHEKRTRIEKLIKGSAITFFENRKNSKKILDAVTKASKSFLFISSHIKDNCLSIIEKLSDDRVNIQIDSHTAYLKAEESNFEIDRKKYIQLNKTLIDVRLNYAKLKREPWKDADYRPCDPLLYFENSFYKKLDPQTRSKNKKVHFYGNDAFLAKQAIDLILKNEGDRKYYYMPHELRRIRSQDKSTVIMDFDSLRDPNDYDLLSQQVREIEDRLYVILQAIKNIESMYFYKYEGIEIPKTNEIRKHISGIFLSFIRSHNLYRDAYWKLAALDRYNLLEKIIPHVDNLEILYTSLEDFSELKCDDLLNSISFWYSLDVKINAAIQERQIKSEAGYTHEIRFEHKLENKTEHKPELWEITGFDEPLEYKYSDSKGIKCIAIIIYYHKLYGNKPIHVPILRSLVDDLDNELSTKSEDIINKPSPKKITEKKLEQDRKAILGVLEHVQSKDEMRNFCDKHIKYSEYYYWFEPKHEDESVACEIIHSKINKDYF